jgi:hypothetical protein
MNDIRMIADKLGKPRASLAAVREWEISEVDVTYEAISHYPTVTMLCFAALGAAALALAVASVMAFLALASL